MKDMWGSARFEELGTGTLVVYHTFILPTSGFASWFRKKAIAMAQEGAGMLVEQIEMERKSNPVLLQRQLETLRSALLRQSRARSCGERH